MVPANGAGTVSRWRATWRIWRVASQNFTSSPSSRAAAKARVRAMEGVKKAGSAGVDIGRKCRPSVTIVGMAELNPPSEHGEQKEVRLGKSDQNLIWLDCEMTGLDPEVEKLIEIAVVVTGP